LSSGIRRNGTRTFGQSGKPAGQHSGHHRTGGQEPARPKTARWAGKAVPAAAIAATLAAGAAAYGFTRTGPADPGKLAAAMSVPLSAGSVAHIGAGKADAAAASRITASRQASTRTRHASASPATASPSTAQPVKIAAATATMPTTPAPTTPAPRTAAPRTAAPAAAAQPAVAAQPSQVPAAAATPAPSQSAGTSATATTFSCSSTGLLPENVTAIVNFLIEHGYSHNAAAGIAGNIYQESKGDPESVGMGGGGLIGFTPLPSGYVTGNPAADLQTQLTAILTYNNGWSAYIPALNAAATPADAAAIYVTDFERAGIPAASTREAAAQDVASACGL
jgi:hypothetical protein